MAHLPSPTPAASHLQKPPISCHRAILCPAGASISFPLRLLSVSPPSSRCRRISSPALSAFLLHTVVSYGDDGARFTFNPGDEDALTAAWQRRQRRFLQHPNSFIEPDYTGNKLCKYEHKSFFCCDRSIYAPELKQAKLISAGTISVTQLCFSRPMFSPCSDAAEMSFRRNLKPV